MLAYTPSGGEAVIPNATPQAQTILTWTADGTSIFIGFMATGSYSGTFICEVGGEPWYTYETSVSDRTAYVADRSVRLAAGTQVSINVLSASTQAEPFYATILGGAS